MFVTANIHKIEKYQLSAPVIHTAVYFIFLVPCIVILGWRNPTRCSCMQIFIYC